MILKSKILFVFLSLAVIVGNHQNKKACDIFNRNLSVIKERINKKKHQNLGEVSRAIDFLEEVTGISSHSDGNYFGRFDPTKEDYTSWLNWFKKNRLRLYWDEKAQKVKVKYHPSEPAQ